MGVAINALVAGIQQAARLVSKTLTFTGAANLGAVGSSTLFTVTGEVEIERIVPMCTVNLTDTGTAGTPTLALGVTGSTSLFVAATTTTAIDAGEFWVDTSPDADGVAIPAACKDIAITDDILATVANATPAVAQVDTLTLPAKAGSTGGDYIVVTADDGTTYACALNKAGNDPAPTGAAYVAASYKVNKDISAATDAASVAALVNTALNTLTGFTAKITSVDVLDGTITLTQVSTGPVAVPVPHNANDSGAGSITTAATTPGEDVEIVGAGEIRFDVWWKPLSPDGNVVAA